MRSSAATVGQKLLGLQYVDETSRPRQWMSSRQRLLFAVLTIGGAWLGERLDDFSASMRHLSGYNYVHMTY